MGFSLYLHAPTVSDPSLAPPGCESYVLAPVPHLGRARVDWKEEGPRYADRILDYLEERYIPGLRGDLVTRRIYTSRRSTSSTSSTPTWAPLSPSSPCCGRAPGSACTTATPASVGCTSPAPEPTPGPGFRAS